MSYKKKICRIRKKICRIKKLYVVEFLKNYMTLKKDNMTLKLFQ